MTGSVIAVNNSRGMIVARTSRGAFSVIELIGGYDVEIGDEISGKLHDEGPCVIKGITQYESMDVIIQGVYTSGNTAVASIR